jgi:hypothetical protein
MGQVEDRESLGRPKFGGSSIHASLTQENWSHLNPFTASNVTNDGDIVYWVPLLSTTQNNRGKWVE